MHVGNGPAPSGTKASSVRLTSLILANSMSVLRFRAAGSAAIVTSGANTPDFPRPLVGFGAGGYYCYVPLPFAKSCVVRIRASKMQFHQINYAIYGPETPVSFDGEEPAVLCPLGDFFGYAWGQPAMKGLLAGTIGQTNYCYFPMPFDRSALVEVVSERATPVELRVEVLHATVPRNTDEGKFYALWRRENLHRDGQGTGASRRHSVEGFGPRPRQSRWCTVPTAR